MQESLVSIPIAYISCAANIPRQCFPALVQHSPRSTLEIRLLRVRDLGLDEWVSHAPELDAAGTILSLIYISHFSKRLQEREIKNDVDRETIGKHHVILTLSVVI